MENNLENKARFFAQYYSQEVLTRDGGFGKFWKLGTDVSIESALSRYGYDYKYYLELKSLEDITEEDLNYCSQICFKNTRMTFASAKDYLEQNYLFGFFMDEEVDYLREKGYAVKWRGLSVEKQIEYGWIKLKNKESITNPNNIKIL